MNDDLGQRVSTLEAKVKYLEDGHSEMKGILKGLEGVPYDIRGVSQKLDTVIEHQKDLKKEVKEEITSIESRLDCIEDAPKELPKMLGLDRTQFYEIVKWIACIILIITGIVSKFYGIDISPIIGLGGK